MKKISTGKLNQKIEIWRIGLVDDGAGGSYPTETLYWATSAEVTPLRSSQGLQYAQEVLKDGFSFLVRYRVDKSIIPTDVIKYRGGKLKITSAPVDYTYKEAIEFKAVWDVRPEGAE